MSISDNIGIFVLVLLAGGIIFVAVAFYRRRVPINRLLRRHFGTSRLDALNISGRKFHARIRADLQRSIDQFFSSGTKIDLASGIPRGNCFSPVTFADLLGNGSRETPTPLEYEDVDIGEEKPVRCAVTGLWLLTHRGEKFAVVMSPVFSLEGESFLQIQVAAEHGKGEFAEHFFAALEKAVREGVCYRGKVLSLEAGSMYSGKLTGITVHRLPGVKREEIILSQSTLELLERNVLRFVQHRPKLAKIGQSTKKGLLFHGPPGNGKTHTIRYLAACLKGHTSLLITAEQMGLLSEYMTLARLLQPSMVVIEDVDMIARERTQMDSPCQESLLNKLLNEMDGLREDADILFILTTNRPADLEQALSARPGRIDQAIEFPVPDAECREKLIRLYSQQIAISDEVIASVVSRTDKVSAAFIKELMRRSMTQHLERADEPMIELQDVDSALKELLMSGSLNLMLFGTQRDGQLPSACTRGGISRT